MFGENHAHIFMNGINYKAAVSRHKRGVDADVIHEHFSAYREKGIQFIRDGGDNLGVSEKAKEIAPQYGITYRTPIFAIYKKGHYGGIVGKPFENMKEYAHLVKEVKSRGGDFIKIMTTGIMDFGTDGSVKEEPLKAEEVKEMVHIAHEEGFHVMAHTNGARAVLEAAFAGVDSVEHGNYVDEEAMWVMKEKGIVWVPTITVVKNMIGCGRFSDVVLEKIWEIGSHNIQKGYEIGVQFALGSDAGAYLVPHGQGVEQERECFQEILGKNKEVTEMLLKGERKIREKFARR